MTTSEPSTSENKTRETRAWHSLCVLGLVYQNKKELDGASC